MVSSSNFGSEGMKYQPRHIHRKAVDHAWANLHFYGHPTTASLLSVSLSERTTVYLSEIYLVTTQIAKSRFCQKKNSTVIC
jgi:hypothetical protein